MPRYIDADALLARYDAEHQGAAGNARRLIEEAPTISPDEVRGVGKWEQSPYTGFSRCSVCKDCYIESYWIEDGKWQYCPRCGSKMEVSEDA